MPLKRLYIWFLETLCEALLLGVFLACTGEKDPNPGKALLFSLNVVVLLSISTGYLSTTVIFRVFWTRQSWWSYPCIAVAAFLIEAEIFLATAGISQLANLPTLVAGICIVFGCTVGGSFLLREWSKHSPHIGRPSRDLAGTRRGRQLRRLSIWFLESLFEIVLLSVFMAYMDERNPDPSKALLASLGVVNPDPVEMLVASLGVVVLLFVTTGYLSTTVIFRVFWNRQSWWSYPCIAVAAFLIEAELLSMIMGISQMEKLPIVFAGVCIVFGCTVGGSFLLRKWSSHSLQEGT